MRARFADSPSRRDVLKLGVVAGGVLTLGFAIPETVRLDRALAADAPKSWPPNAFVQIGEDETVTIVSNKSEMGQDIFTSHAMLIAEELECDWSKVRVVSAPVADIYNSTLYPLQFTGGSTSIRTTYDQYRIIGATARRMLIAAAAASWNVSPTTCWAENGFVVGTGEGQRVSFGKITKAAAALPVPTDVPLKARKDFKIVGQPRLRVDALEKIEGRAAYSIDLSLPNMVTALILHGPVFGARPTKVNADAARAAPGVKAVVPVSTGVAVLADGFWHAKKARDLLQVEWDSGPAAGVSTDELIKQYRGMAAAPGTIAQKIGDPDAAMAKAALRVTADYTQPYLAHAPMEPLSCIVDLKAGSCEIWIGTQSQTIDRNLIAKLTFLKPEQISLHTTYLGGGFGRRQQIDGSDWLREAIEIAKVSSLGAPIKLIWTREDDITQAYYRPLWVDRVTAGLDRHGMPVVWSQTGVGQSIVAGTQFESQFTKDGVDRFSVEGAVDLPYAIPNVQIDLHTTKVEVPVGFWRSVGHSHNAFVKETFVDQLAQAAGKDPVDYRRALLANQPEHLGVLELAVQKAGWKRPLEDGYFQGFAMHASYGSFVAMVAEISLTSKRVLKVERLVCAVDCGLTVNPDSIVAQIEGGANFGLSTALFSEIPIKQGKMGANNFTAYKLMRMHQSPRIEVHLVDSARAPGGVGEIATPVVAPALVNALFAATGERVSSLPLVGHGFAYP